jgi:curved DNA-binding protein CbpA
MQDYYSILGLKNGASKTEIKLAYRRLAMKWHPDKNPSPDAKQKFIEITEAYDALMAGKTNIFKSRFQKSSAQPTYKTTPKTKYNSTEESRREQTHRHFSDLRKRFLDLREKYNHPKYVDAKKKELYGKSNLYFALSGGLLLGAIAFPFIVGNQFLLIPSIPLGLGFSLRLFFFAGRKKMRADMLFSMEENYSIAELRDFFDESPDIGIKFRD